MVRPEDVPLKLEPLRHDVLDLVRAVLDAADAARLVAEALDERTVADLSCSRSFNLVALGKAAPRMVSGFLSRVRSGLREGLVAGTHLDADLPGSLRWIEAGHPVPTAASEEAGREALRLAASVSPGETLVVLISGGGSALLAAPVEGLTLASKQEVTRRLLLAGADIHSLNAVRKHLSAVKGGRLAAASRGATLALAISDVVGNDLSVIASGPTTPDPSTYGDALAVLDRLGGRAAYPPDAVRMLELGARSLLPETPKPGDPRLDRSKARVIGSRETVLATAERAARLRGYDVHVIDSPVTGEARETAPSHVERMIAIARGMSGKACVISGGETTVEVRGRGRGGRNQEFALAALPVIASAGVPAVLASFGTDGVDGPTNAAGAVVDVTSASRAEVRALQPVAFLENNDSYAFFEALGDLVVTGPTGTNVGDVQILLTG